MLSEFSESISDAYFTPPKSVELIHKLLNDYGWLDGKILEPCSGDGFLVVGLENVTRWDLNQYSQALDRQGDFLEQHPEGFDLVLTNPPFGFLGGLAAEMMNHASKFAPRLAFVLPQCFRKIQRLDRINPLYHPVLDVTLPDQTFLLPSGEKKFVQTCFQMWERRTYRRFQFGAQGYQEFFKKVPKEDADYYLRTQGSTAGIVLDGLDFNPRTGCFLKGGRELIEQYDWTTIAGCSSGAHSIGLQDIAWGLRSSDIDSYLKYGVIKELINGTYSEIGGTLEAFF